MDFLSEENVCGQSLLKLTSRGSAIIAEMLRLSDNIPRVLYGQGPEAKQFAPIIFDFEYLKSVDFFEERIQKDPDQADLDELFRTNYFPLLERFYVLFDSIYKYYWDLQNLIDQINKEVFIQYTIENILQNLEGKKLLGESFYLYGCMLLLLDEKITGTVREKIIVSYTRYVGGQHTLPNINEVCKLCKNTGYIPARFNNGTIKRPPTYPEEYFTRYPCDKDVLWAIINSIQDDDIYRQGNAFPSPEHRSTALSSQAAMLYVLLRFLPKVLQNDTAKMREITDKHFNDNWVISYYMGHMVDISFEWEQCKAAKSALSFTIVNDKIKGFVDDHQKKLKDCLKKLTELLNEGILTEDYVLDKVNNLLNVLRESNVTLRWLLLHRNTSIKKAKELLAAIDPNEILRLMLLTSQFEFKLKSMFEQLLESKHDRWEEDKNNCVEKMQELSEYFSGTKALTKQVADENYRQYFAEMEKQIASLDYSDSTFATRKIMQIVKALEDIEQYHQINNNLQIKAYLFETRANLKHMARSTAIKKQVLVNLAQISDFAYSWECLKEYLPLMQEKIKSDPNNSLLLRATFMKLRSIMDAPMVRIIQANSQDMLSVSKYYSGELIKFVKRVLQIIPKTVFDLLEEIILLLTTKIKKIPLKFNRNDLKDYSLFEERKRMAKLTYQISIFTDSILSMDTYLIGVIEVDPKVILEDGIRREMVKLICKILERVLVFKLGTIEDFEKRISLLSENLEGFKTALEYIQDFLNIYGLKIWQEEFNKVINRYIDLESNTFLSKRLKIDEFIDNDDYIPIPQQVDNQSATFMGRLVREILSLTDPKSTVFIEHTNCFYEVSTFKETINLKTIWQLRKCIGISGLNGLDKLLSFMIVAQMKGMVKILNREVSFNDKKLLNDLFGELKELGNPVEKYDKLYSNATRVLKPVLSSALTCIQKIGQMIILRMLICKQLSSSGRIYSDKLFFALENLNMCVMNDITHKYLTRDVSDETQQQLEAENQMFSEVLKLMNFIGFSDPLKKIFFTTGPQDNLPLFLSILVISQISNLVYAKNVKTLMRRNKNDLIDYNQLLLGTIAFLNQYHGENSKVFLGFIAQYLKSAINYGLFQKDQKAQVETNIQIGNLLIFFEDFLRFSCISKEYAKNFIPLSLLSNLRSMTTDK